MAAYKAHIPPDAPEALPSVLYDHRMVLREGGETVELIHVPNAHTDGDTLVRFRKANVIAMGTSSSMASSRSSTSAAAAASGHDQGCRHGTAHDQRENQNRSGARARCNAHRAARVQIHAGDDRADCAEDEGGPDARGDRRVPPCRGLPLRNGGRGGRLVETIYDSYRNDDLTIGYEGATMDEFLAALKAAGVERLIDVRALPLSRRPCFSENALARRPRGSGHRICASEGARHAGGGAICGARRAA